MEAGAVETAAGARDHASPADTTTAAGIPGPKTLSAGAPVAPVIPSHPGSLPVIPAQAGVSVGPPARSLAQPISDTQIRIDLARSGMTANANQASLTPAGFLPAETPSEHSAVLVRQLISVIQIGLSSLLASSVAWTSR